MDLEHNGLRIRNAVPEDAPILTHWWNDGAVMAHAGFPRGLGLTEEMVENQIRRDTDRDRRLLKERHPTWKLCAISSDPAFERSYGKRADRKRRLYNGRLECTYYIYY